MSPEQQGHLGHDGEWLLERFQLKERRGQGGMGVVWRAWDDLGKCDVAIKMLPPEVALDYRAKRQLLEEARATIPLAHPNVVKLMDLHQTDDTYFLAMEYVDGPSLKEELENRDRIPEAQVRAWLLQICDGLKEAHRKGIIHRDIKPANLMIAPDGLVKIADFGIARIVADSTTRRAGAEYGSLPYMSPEQLRGRACDARSDLYSLGVTAYELLSGDLPFSAGHIPHQIMTERPESLSEVAPALGHVIARLLEKAPDDRIQDAESLRSVLHSGVTGLPPLPSDSAPHNLETVQTAGGRRSLSLSKPGARWRRWVGTIGGGLAVALLVLAIVLAGRAVRGDGTLWSRLFPAVAPPTEVPTVDASATIMALAATEAKFAAEDARHLAQNAGAAQVLPELWRSGERRWRVAQEVDARGGFSAAVGQYQIAEEAYRSAFGRLWAGTEMEAAVPWWPVSQTQRAHADAQFAPLAIENGQGQKLVLVPAGAFQMGTPQGADGWREDESPVHEVKLTRGFYIASREVTNGQYQWYQSERKRQEYGEPTEPVAFIGWFEAVEYCTWLTETEREAKLLPEGWEYRLPTEAEWEYASRAGAPAANSFADEPVQAAQGNAWGLFAMRGGVWEWCLDWYGAKFYERSVLLNPTGPSDGTERVLRGGQWRPGTQGTRPGRRHSSDPQNAFVRQFGFRIVAAPADG